jgi:hypothetical protein
MQLSAGFAAGFVVFKEGADLAPVLQVRRSFPMGGEKPRTCKTGPRF